MNTPEKYRHNWARVFVVEEDEDFLTVRADYDEGECLATFQGTLFEADGDEGWFRSDFEIVEGVYEADTVIGLLRASGFVDVEVRVISEDEEKRPFRWLFCGRRD